MQKALQKSKKTYMYYKNQNKLQDKQIKQLAKYLNLTMHQVSRHNVMLYEMGCQITYLNKTLHQLIGQWIAIRYESGIINYFQARIYRMYTSLYALRGDIDSLFEYMRILASQELNPTIIPPNILKTYYIKLKMTSNQMPD